MPTRLRYALKLAAIHFGISASIALVAAFFVFVLLYPTPFRQMLNVGSIYIMLVGIDVICGPLLTLLVASPKKTKLATFIDFSVIGAVQLAALLYGLHSLYAARPAMVVFETDRLVVVQASELRYDDYPSQLAEFKSPPWFGVRYAQVTSPKTGAEMLKGIELGLQGINPSQMPSTWREFDQQTNSAMQKRYKPLAKLIAARPSYRHELQAAAKATGLSIDKLYFLPFTSSKTYDYVVILDADANILGYSKADGFIN